MSVTALHDFFDAVAQVIGEENISRDPTTGALPGPHGQQSYQTAIHSRQTPNTSRAVL